MSYCLAPKCKLSICTQIKTHGMDPWGATHPWLYIVGEAPGNYEDRQGIPFVGPAGELLRDLLRRIGVSMDHVRICNTVRCGPWNEKKQKIGTPSKAHIDHCLPSLLADIDRSRPKCIITLGSIATKALTKTRATISAIRGSVQSILIGENQYPVIPAFHPDFIRRSGMDVTNLTFLMSDIKKAWLYAQGHGSAPQATEYAGRDYGMLKSLDEIQTYMDTIVAKCQADPAMFITADFEAGALEDWRPQNPMLGLGISCGPHQARFIPMDHWDSPLRGQNGAIAEILAPMEFLSISNQNVKFDRLWAKRRLGIEWNNLRFDTMLGHHCKFAGTRPNDLETMGGLYLQEPAWSYKLLDSVKEAVDHIKAQKRLAKKEKSPERMAYWAQWEALGPNKMGKGYAIAKLADISLYCCIDCDVTWRLTPVVEKMLAESGLYQVYLKHYHEGLIPFGEMQYDGIAIDNRVVAQLKEDLPAEMKKIELEINSSKYVKQAMVLLNKDPATEFINMNSPPQMACLIYDSMKMPPARIPNKSARTTEAGQLEQLLGYCKRGKKKTATALLEQLGSWRSLGKYLSSYVESNVVCQDHQGLVHPTWNLMGTRTGRMACDSPPVHSAPKKHGLRKQYFSRWHEYGGVILGADESQVELRIFASLADDYNLINFYNNMAGADLHRYMASLLFNKAYEDVTDEERSIAKTCVFASLYGGGAGNLAAETGMTHGQAKVIHAKFTSIVAIEQYKAWKTAELMQFGYVSTPFGRLLPISIGNTEGQQMHAIRQAMNTPIQSVASDLVARAIMRARIHMAQMGLKSKIIIFHHDAIYWDVFPGEFFQIVALAQRVMIEEPMAEYPWLKVPLKLGIEFGSSWGQKIEIEAFDAHSLTIKFKAKKDEESCYDRYYKEVVSQFEGPMGQVLQLQNIQSHPREVVAIVTPRMAG